MHLVRVARGLLWRLGSLRSAWHLEDERGDLKASRLARVIEQWLDRHLMNKGISPLGAARQLNRGRSSALQGAHHQVHRMAVIGQVLPLDIVRSQRALPSEKGVWGEVGAPAGW